MDDSRRSGYRPIWLLWLPLVLGPTSYIIFDLTVGPNRGLWFDEYATLYFSDPTAPFSFLVTDTNPPLYYFLVRIARSSGLEPQSSLWVTNFSAALVFSTIAYLFMRRTYSRLVAGTIIAIVLAGPAVLTFALEGRGCALGQFACLATTAGLSTQSEAGRRPSDFSLLALLAGLSAATHIYAGLYVSVLGVAFGFSGIVTNDRSKLVAGITVCAASILVTAIWVITARRVLLGGNPSLSWIPSSTSYTVGQLWFFNKMLSGAGFNLVVLLVGISLCALIPGPRYYALIFCFAAASFLAVPILVSTKVPMLAGRYFAIAVPSLILIALNAGAATVMKRDRRVIRLAAASFLSLFALVNIMTAHKVAARFTAEFRWPYDSSDVRAYVDRHKQTKIRVLVPDMPTVGGLSLPAIYISSYKAALDRSDVALDSSLSSVADVSDYPGPLIGWGEHVFWFDPTHAFDLTHADEQRVLRALNMTNVTNRPLRLEKRRAGFFLLNAS
jgi:hypothetical protein